MCADVICKLCVNLVVISIYLFTRYPISNYCILFCFFSQWLNKGLLLSLEKYSKANIHIGLSRCAPNYDMFLYFDSDFKNS